MIQKISYKNQNQISNLIAMATNTMGFRNSKLFQRLNANNEIKVLELSPTKRCESLRYTTGKHFLMI